LHIENKKRYKWFVLHYLKFNFKLLKVNENFIGKINIQNAQILNTLFCMKSKIR